MTERVGRGLFGSLRGRVQAEVRELGRQNKTLRRARSGLARRTFLALITGVSLSRILLLYLVLSALGLAFEWLITAKWPCLLPGWDSTNLSPFVKEVTGLLITAQVGILAIVSVAVGVVTLLSQRDDRSSSTTDVRLYYSQSLAYEVVTSGVALLLVLFVQLFWPGQLLLHWFQAVGSNLSFELALTIVHVLWMAVNG
jgi:hypothetical protein